jgi:hypothetical protein
MRRARPSDDVRRLAVKARLQGVPSSEIAKHLDRNHNTIKGYLSNCGGMLNGKYQLNALTARALFTEQELLEVGAVWDGRSWVGVRRGQSEQSSGNGLGGDCVREAPEDMP